MASNRPLWVEDFALDQIPPLPCPHCKNGTLAIVKETEHTAQVAGSRQYFEVDGYDPEFDYRRFIFLMQCTTGACREPVAVAGGTYHRETRDWKGNPDYETRYRPDAMIPGPPLMVIPVETPDKAAAAMRQSFVLFWGDRGAAANRLRISVERIMDAEGIPAGGNLDSRIKAFGGQHPNMEDTLHALRHVGNLGSHDGEVGREELLDAFEIYQEWLRKFYGKYDAHIAGLTQKLITKKGNYKP